MSDEFEGTANDDTPAPGPPDPAAAGPEAAPEEPLAPLPSFPKRVLDVFFSPGQLMEALAARPAWGLALVAAVVLIALQTALIPWEVFEAFQREAALARGQAPPEIPEGMADVMRIVTPIGAALAVTIFTFLFAGIYTLVFTFILGDEGKYRQYLAAMVHAMLIPTIVGLALVPLKISQQNPQFTLNLGIFFGFLGDGYVGRVFSMMDISQIWSTLVTALGVSAIDQRRSFASAATILMIFLVAISMIFAIFTPAV